MTDITELAQSLKAAAENAIGAHERLAAYPYGEIIDISQHEGEQIDIDITDINEFHEEASPANVLALVEALEKAQKRIAELENNEVQEEGNQFLVVRHPGKVPVIKHPVGELEDYLRQIFKADPLATIDIVTHRYYGVGGQFVEDADEYLHEMSIKVEAE
ncbi:ead/Ea22-like family protein [Klebsiella pneumoniae]|nr:MULTISPECIES: ead/Ea22-like family protein [Klebsiella]HCI6013112.1 ead/Ea22-like family protein [Klebsiella quasipneumoniae subsp. similipneumoniae]HDG7684076.1 ead/Ea22-like family protein [Klebsiella quasipneumoniae]MCA5477696.1 ead/Ea22-like family protein [Klebsiella pneumoniae]MCA5482798.1 ead/Ea22-like family protein [Klebsiella pneumoniae]MCA5541541.1 ead/Ea22-like family protein [Klebsiella pneumoniae]